MYIHARSTVFKHIFPHTLSINYGQILHKITLVPFRHVYYQDYYTLNDVKCFYLDVFHTGFLPYKILLYS